MQVEIVPMIDRYENGILRIERDTSPDPKPPSWFNDLRKFGQVYVALFTDHINHDAVAGFVAFDHSRVTKIHRLAVALRFRQKGIGRAMLDHVLDSQYCRPYVLIDTTESNAAMELLSAAKFRLHASLDCPYSQRWRYDAEVTA